MPRHASVASRMLRRSTVPRRPSPEAAPRSAAGNIAAVTVDASPGRQTWSPGWQMVDLEQQPPNNSKGTTMSIRTSSKRKMAQRAALAASGLALAAGVGLAGAGAASAASPALTIKAHSIWTVEVKGGGCELVQFTIAGHTFVSDLAGDAGTWAGGTSTIGMTWTAGGDTGLTFNGKAVSPTQYKGNFGGTGAGLHGKLVKGEVSGC
jgi:hypothetical protein